ncbi:MAG: hypothetical protein V4564_00800 [Pseudomonadota bacterium]|uniref:hypothetical protein n=1 Tax=Sphingomonas sp. ERG5 TaxID=1381597 RepID=UPI00126A761E|nr:hypothetical protein [Sphingomonas sp. ERG5]
MKFIKIIYGVIIFLSASSVVSCADSSKISEQKIAEANRKCPILFQFDEKQYLDLRKPWNAAEDAKNHIRNGKRMLIEVQSDLEGFTSLHDYKYSKLWTNINRNIEEYKQICNLELTGVGSAVGVMYQIAHKDEYVCRDQVENMKIYSEQYNNYVLNDIANDPKCRILLRE